MYLHIVDVRYPQYLIYSYFIFLVCLLCKIDLIPWAYTQLVYHQLVGTKSILGILVYAIYCLLWKWRRKLRRNNKNNKKKLNCFEKMLYSAWIKALKIKRKKCVITFKGTMFEKIGIKCFCVLKFKLFVK